MVKRTLMLAAAVLVLAGCSSDRVDEDAWRADLEQHDAGYGDKVWQGYVDAWTSACEAESLQPLIDRVHTETRILHRTWEQARINVEHACPDRVDELAEAVRAEG